VVRALRRRFQPHSEVKNGFCCSLARSRSPRRRPKHGPRISTACTIDRPTPRFRVVWMPKARSISQLASMVHESDHPATALGDRQPESHRNTLFQLCAGAFPAQASRCGGQRIYISLVPAVHRSKRKARRPHCHLWGPGSLQVIGMGGLFTNIKI